VSKASKRRVPKDSPKVDRLRKPYGDSPEAAIGHLIDRREASSLFGQRGKSFAGFTSQKLCRGCQNPLPGKPKTVTLSNELPARDGVLLATAPHPLGLRRTTSRPTIPARLILLRPPS
jgi:hypothetical protein